MKRKMIFLLTLLVMLLATGCGEKKQELTKVKVVLDYLPNTNHTGLYVAKELGYYEEMGLDVEIVEPADGVTLTLVAVGEGDFGLAYQEDITYALTSEEPLPIKTIATVIQHNTSGFVSYAGKNIKSPKDFENKTYSGWGAPGESAVIKAVMNSVGADFSTVKMVTADGAGYEILKDKVDLQWYFEAWDCILAKRAGIELNYIPLREYDKRLDYYTPTIITNNNMIENNPKTVSAFLAATKKGYEYAIENSEEAAKILYDKIPEYDLEMLKESQAYLADKYIADAPKWGMMKDEVWDNYTDFMYENGLIDKKISAKECYTNEFLPE